MNQAVAARLYSGLQVVEVLRTPLTIDATSALSTLHVPCVKPLTCHESLRHDVSSSCKYRRRNAGSENFLEIA